MKRFFAIVFIIGMVLSLSYTHAVETDSTESPASQTDKPVVYGYATIGENVVRIQLRLRELGYFMFKPTGNFQSMTVSSAIAFQEKQTDSEGRPIAADGFIGPQSFDILFSLSAQRQEITAHIPFGKTSTELAVIGKLIKWNEVKEMLVVGETYTVTDCYSGETFNVIYVGGENHAEIECATAADADKYKSLFGGDYNYSKRPITVQIGDDQVAASLQGQPHGSDTVSGNNMDGHSCLFFSGSTSHTGNLPDIEHIAQVNKAAGKS